MSSFEDNYEDRKYRLLPQDDKLDLGAEKEDTNRPWEEYIRSAETRGMRENFYTKKLRT